MISILAELLTDHTVPGERRNLTQILIRTSNPPDMEEESVMFGWDIIFKYLITPGIYLLTGWLIHHFVL